MILIVLIKSLQVNFIKICQTNKVLVTASKDGSFCIWDVVQVKIYFRHNRQYNVVLILFF